MRYLLTMPILCLVACAPQASDEVSQARGKTVFENNCATCHGLDGSGDGHTAEALDVRPPDLTKIASRRGGVWPMLEVMSIIDGYTKRTDARPGMPIISEVAEGPSVDFDTGNGLVATAPADLISVAIYLESIQDPPPEAFVPQ